MLATIKATLPESDLDRYAKRNEDFVLITRNLKLSGRGRLSGDRDRQSPAGISDRVEIDVVAAVSGHQELPCIRAEENGCAKHALKSGDQSPILRTTLLHAEDVQHFGSAAKRNDLLLLSHGERRKENGNQPVLTPRNSVSWMPRDCKRNCPFRRSCSDVPFAGRLMGNPHSTNGREAKPRFWFTLLRLSRTS
jgi:hypothetical protein